MSKKLVPYLVSNLAVFLLCLAAAECFLRVTKYRFWHIPQVDIEVVPGGKLVVPHPELAYVNPVGQYEITLKREFRFVVNHLTPSQRRTHEGQPPGGDERDEIWIFGCSFTYGWSLNDDETFPWRVQKELPRFNVVNFGTNGYGTVQSLLQFREALVSRPKKPRVVVLIYAQFHDERNVLTSNWRASLRNWHELEPRSSLPYARLNNGRLVFKKYRADDDTPWYSRRLALGRLLEEALYQMQDRGFNQHAVSEALIRQFGLEASAAGAVFIVPVIQGNLEMRETLSGDMRVELQVPGMRNIPYDDHPSAKANVVYAKNLLRLLKEKALPRLKTQGRL